MTHRNVRQLTLSFIAIATLVAPLAGHAEIRSKSRDLVVMEPRDISEQAQLPGNSLFLHPDNAGRTFLYIEQQGGKRLSVFDVSDPGKIKLVSSTPLATSGAFDFVRPLGETAELVRFRDGIRVAVLDLRKAKKPNLILEPALAAQMTTEALGETAFLAVSEVYNYAPATPRDYQIVDISKPYDPALLTTVKQVKHRAVNSETGTTFLLGSDGLTVVRRTRVEEEYKSNSVDPHGY